METIRNGRSEVGATGAHDCNLGIFSVLVPVTVRAKIVGSIGQGVRLGPVRREVTLNSGFGVYPCRLDDLAGRVCCSLERLAANTPRKETRPAAEASART